MLALTALLLAAFAAPAPALTVGIGEQAPGFMNDPRFEALGIKHARIVVPYDVTDHRGQTAVLEEYLGVARDKQIDVLVTFSRSRIKSRNDKLPRLRTYQRAVGEFLRRYPFVRTYVPWNEPNLCSSRTCNNPKAAAKMYLALKKMCSGCTVLAADMVDTENMTSWLKKFQKYTKGKPRLWGLHNYVDANAGTKSGTKRMLKAVRGEIWFTETGGIVDRWGTKNKKNKKKGSKRTTKAFPIGIKPAAKATKRVFSLARLSPRITRAYFYHWKQDPKGEWDSAFFDRFGNERPAFGVFRSELAKHQAPAA